MKVLIKQARICGTSAPLRGQVKDIFIQNGIITQISDSISEAADQIIDIPHLHISTGWVDGFAHFNDPGFEHKETLTTGANAAAAGGFTDVLLLPNTQPAISSKSTVEYIKQKAKALPVNLHPIGAVSKDAQGKELSEMYDMHQSGAIAFSDGTQSIQNTGLLLKALQYVLPMEACIIQVPNDKSIQEQGLINEGIISTQLGLPGKPAIAEELMIARDIELVKYTGSRLHITGVSTHRGLQLIHDARQQGLNISCSVSPMHLLFCDEDLQSYDTNLKLNPPLRTAADRDALREAFQNGNIDCIASHHQPQHWDDKTCEFEYAKYGSESLEAVFAVAGMFNNNIDSLTEMMSIAPRKIFGLSISVIAEGSKAICTLFVPGETYTFSEQHIKSQSKNNPFVGHSLKGKVVGIINQQHISLNS